MTYTHAKASAASMSNQLTVFDGLLDSDPAKRMYKIFSDLKDDWRRSKYGKSSARVIKKILQRDDIVINQAMCLGLGEMEYNLDYCAFCYDENVCPGGGCYKQARSFAQLAAFASWVDLISKSSSLIHWDSPPCLDMIQSRDRRPTPVWRLQANPLFRV